MGMSSFDTNNADELWNVYVYYVEYGISNSGKVMYTNMELSFEVVSYYFTPTTTNVDNFPVKSNIKYFQYLKEEQNYLWAGKTNYVRGYGDEINQTFSWLGTKRVFGFFSLFTTNEICYTDEDKELLVVGPRFQSY